MLAPFGKHQSGPVCSCTAGVLCRVLSHGLRATALLIRPGCRWAGYAGKGTPACFWPVLASSRRGASGCLRRCRRCSLRRCWCCLHMRRSLHRRSASRPGLGRSGRRVRGPRADLWGRPRRSGGRLQRTEAQPALGVAVVARAVGVLLPPRVSRARSGGSGMRQRRLAEKQAGAKRLLPRAAQRSAAGQHNLRRIRVHALRRTVWLIECLRSAWLMKTGSCGEAQHFQRMVIISTAFALVVPRGLSLASLSAQ